MADELAVIRDKLTRMGHYIQELEPLGKRYSVHEYETIKDPIVYRNVKTMPSLYRRYISSIRTHLERRPPVPRKKS